MCLVKIHIQYVKELCPVYWTLNSGYCPQYYSPCLERYCLPSVAFRLTVTNINRCSHISKFSRMFIFVIFNHAGGTFPFRLTIQIYIMPAHLQGLWSNLYPQVIHTYLSRKMDRLFLSFNNIRYHIRKQNMRFFL